MRQSTLKFGRELIKLIYIEDPREAELMIEKLRVSPVKAFGLDIETAKGEEFSNFVPIKRGNRFVGPQPGLDPYMSKIRLMQIYDGHRVFVFDIWKTGFAGFGKLASAKKFIAHNGIFEIKHLTHAGFSFLDIHCSMLQAILTDRAERSPYEPEEDDEELEADGLGKYRMTGYGLDAVTQRLFGIKIGKFFQTSNWNAPVLSREQIHYAGLDAVLTYKIAKLLMPKVKKYGMLKIYALLKKMQHVISDMELTGFGIDLKAHKRLVKEWEAQHATADAECKRFFGSVNLNSPKQMGEWLERKCKDKPKILKLWPRSPSSTDEKVKYSFNRAKIYPFYRIPAIAAYINFKKIDKLLNTYGNTLTNQIHPITKRLHCSFSLGETRTGRLSSYNPNLQNLPRSSSVREIFTAAHGKSLVVADFSQIEIRVAGEVSGDPTIRNAFKNGIDLHKLIVTELVEKPYDKITDDERQLGKAINFGLLFGMGPTKLQTYVLINYGHKITMEQSQQAYEHFHFKRYRRYSEWSKSQRDLCERVGWVRTPMGKRRKLGEDEVYTKSVNTPVQGGAAEVMFTAMVLLRDRLKPFQDRIKIVLSVHDEIILECPKADGGVAMRLLNLSMMDGMKSVFPNAPLRGIVEVHEGGNWQEAKKGKKKESEKPTKRTRDRIQTAAI